MYKCIHVLSHRTICMHTYWFTVTPYIVVWLYLQCILSKGVCASATKEVCGLINVARNGIHNTLCLMAVRCVIATESQGR